MIRLNLAREPVWLDLGHDVRVLVPPLTTGMIAAARDTAAFQSVPADAGPEERQVALARGVAVVAVQAWEGVALAEGDDPAPLTAENVSALMDIYHFSLMFHRRYIEAGLLLESEKNVSAPLPDGTSEPTGAKATAARARGRRSAGAKAASTSKRH